MIEVPKLLFWIMVLGDAVTLANICAFLVIAITRWSDFKTMFHA